MVRHDEPDDAARVLVAVITRPRDLQLVQTQHWYRIPLKHAPAQLGAEYVAFYQTAAFGEAERWSVRSYAPILAYRITTRRELLPDEAEHPRANEQYYRLDVGPLATLAVPVPAAKLRRVTFINTTFGQLRRARDVRELWHPREDEEQAGEGLWAAGLAGKSLRGGGERSGRKRDL
ncbi:MAG: hypothetical protein HC876_13420 [Chloroflexaceae bacterium]|nr:hypothetical protein [Chloroflexaceae bacterium]